MVPFVNITALVDFNQSFLVNKEKLIITVFPPSLNKPSECTSFKVLAKLNSCII